MHFKSIDSFHVGENKIYYLKIGEMSRKTIGMKSRQTSRQDDIDSSHSLRSVLCQTIVHDRGGVEGNDVLI